MIPGEINRHLVLSISKMTMTVRTSCLLAIHLPETAQNTTSLRPAIVAPTIKVVPSTKVALEISILEIHTDSLEAILAIGVTALNRVPDRPTFIEEISIIGAEGSVSILRI